MPLFKYKAINDLGVQVADTVEASNPLAVAERLERLGYLPLSISARHPLAALTAALQKSSIRTDQVIVFTRQLATLLKAGVPLLGCLEVLVEQTTQPAFRQVLQRVSVEIQNGQSFSEALAQHPGVFSDLYRHTIQAGEAGGALEEVLERLSYLLEHEHESHSRVRAALRYPILVAGSVVMAFLVLMVVVVPKFSHMFEQLGGDLPALTRALIGFHHLLADFWYVPLAGVPITAAGILRFLQTERGRNLWDDLRMRLPVLGPLTLKAAVSQFARMFETLNSSGLPIVETLGIVSQTVGNRALGREIEKASLDILQGESIAASLARRNYFPPLVIRMIAVGEQSGSLDTMLRNVSRHYDTEVEYAVKQLSGVVEPALTAVMGLLVLILALAIFLPMWDLTRFMR